MRYQWLNRGVPIFLFRFAFHELAYFTLDHSEARHPSEAGCSRGLNTKSKTRKGGGPHLLLGFSSLVALRVENWVGTGLGQLRDWQPELRERAQDRCLDAWLCRE
ncbi:hypothetical protein LZ32DRAFT_229232 [Colletotrichum eremochloae]|nr:hypothetical protein LZ32DRAFT_229232 [Colletotrichum eremochloae]